MQKNHTNQAGSSNPARPDHPRTAAGTGPVPASPSHPLTPSPAHGITPSPSHLSPSPSHPIVVPHAGLAEPILYPHPPHLPAAPRWSTPRVPGPPASDHPTATPRPPCIKEPDAPTVTEINDALSDQLLGEWSNVDTTVPMISSRFRIPLRLLLAWERRPDTRAKLDEIEALVRRRTRHAAAHAQELALSSLATLINDVDYPETMRKSALAIMKLAGGSSSPAHPLTPSPSHSPHTHPSTGARHSPRPDDDPGAPIRANSPHPPHPNGTTTTPGREAGGASAHIPNLIDLRHRRARPDFPDTSTHSRLTSCVSRLRAAAGAALPCKTSLRNLRPRQQRNLARRLPQQLDGLVHSGVPPLCPPADRGVGLDPHALRPHPPDRDVVADRRLHREAVRQLHVRGNQQRPGALGPHERRRAPLAQSRSDALAGARRAAVDEHRDLALVDRDRVRDNLDLLVAPRRDEERIGRVTARCLDESRRHVGGNGGADGCPLRQEERQQVQEVDDHPPAVAANVDDHVRELRGLLEQPLDVLDLVVGPERGNADQRGVRRGVRHRPERRVELLDLLAGDRDFLDLPAEPAHTQGSGGVGLALQDRRLGGPLAVNRAHHLARLSAGPPVVPPSTRSPPPGTGRVAAATPVITFRWSRIAPGGMIAAWLMPKRMMVCCRAAARAIDELARSISARLSARYRGH